MALISLNSTFVTPLPPGAPAPPLQPDAVSSADVAGVDRSLPQCTGDPAPPPY